MPDETPEIREEVTPPPLPIEQRPGMLCPPPAEEE